MPSSQHDRALWAGWERGAGKQRCSVWKMGPGEMQGRCVREPECWGHKDSEEQAYEAKTNMKQPSPELSEVLKNWSLATMYGFCEQNLFRLTLRRYFLRLTEVLCLWRRSRWTADEPRKAIHSKQAHFLPCECIFYTRTSHCSPKFIIYTHYMHAYNAITQNSTILYMVHVFLKISYMIWWSQGMILNCGRF